MDTLDQRKSYHKGDAPAPATTPRSLGTQSRRSHPSPFERSAGSLGSLKQHWKLIVIAGLVLLNVISWTNSHCSARPSSRKELAVGGLLCLRSQGSAQKGSHAAARHGQPSSRRMLLSNHPGIGCFRRL